MRGRVAEWEASPTGTHELRGVFSLWCDMDRDSRTMRTAKTNPEGLELRGVFFFGIDLVSDGKDVE